MRQAYHGYDHEERKTTFLSGRDFFFGGGGGGVGYQCRKLLICEKSSHWYWWKGAQFNKAATGKNSSIVIFNPVLKISGNLEIN